jgi:hypothetical protein
MSFWFVSVVPKDLNFAFLLVDVSVTSKYTNLTHQVIIILIEKFSQAISGWTVKKPTFRRPLLSSSSGYYEHICPVYTCPSSVFTVDQSPVKQRSHIINSSFTISRYLELQFFFPRVLRTFPFQTGSRLLRFIAETPSFITCHPTNVILLTFDLR